MKKTITLSESEQPQSTHEKGTYLEDLFAEYMKDELGWDSTKTRTQMKSYYTNRRCNRRKTGLAGGCVYYIVILVFGDSSGYIHCCYLC